MMAAIVVSEPLCYLMTVFGRYDRSFIHGIMSRFYHEDELYAAKVELAKIVAQLPSAPDGWSKLVSMKGTPTLRRGADGAHRRSQEAEDVLEMTAIADVSKIDLPKFVAADLDRLPGFTGRLVDPVLAVPTGADEVIQRLQVMEQKLSQLCATSSTIRVCDPGVAVPGVAVPSVTVPLHGDQQAFPPLPNCSTDEGVHISDHQPAVVSKSWADQATEMAQVKPNLTFNNTRRKVVVCGKATGGNVKGVPRQLTCFVGRLDSSVSAEELTDFLKDKGIADAKCVKLVAKDGRIFSTSAFRVSCSATYKPIFYDEASWPIGAELRDWVFYNRNGQ